MHRYLRAIGFSEIKKKSQLQSLLQKVIQTVSLTEKKGFLEGASGRDFVSDEDDNVYAEYFLDLCEDAGICVRGEIDENGKFEYEYYFPYMRGNHISSQEDVSIERHAEKESYAGVCDDLKVGISIIFYLQNMVPYKRLQALNRLPISGTTLVLGGLSVNGMIMMPIIKNERDKRRVQKASQDRNQLIAQARMGDEEAIESLTLEDMDTYTVISRKIQKEDVFSLVDTYFMPYGVECDQYSVLGEILEVSVEKNVMTKEEVVMMTLECNELTLSVCINKKDLFGEPAVGRRFKGVIWLQGYINFPE